MTPARILIVEDEFITLDSLRDTLTDLGYHLSGDAMNADEAIAVLEAGQTDLAILDVHLRDSYSGIWIGEQIKKRFQIPFIYLTAFSDKSTIAAAAAVAPASYLIKPFSPPDLFAAIELALHNYARAGAPTPGESSGNLLINDAIFVKTDTVYERINLRDVAVIQAFRNYLELTVEGTKHVIRATLSEFTDRLPADRFVQTHRSYVVNLGKVVRLGGNFLQVGQEEIPLSRSMKADVLARLDVYR